MKNILFEHPELDLQLVQKVMENGEERTSLRSGDHSVTKTVAGSDGGWQNAHFHKGLSETYVVILGRMGTAFVCPRDGVPYTKLYYPGKGVDSVCTFGPNVRHNVFLFPGSMIYTVKHGEPIGNPEKKENDWWPAEKHFSEWSLKQFF